MRVRSPSTCSRNRCCESDTTVEFSRSLAALTFGLSRCTLNAAETTCRSCSESASTCPAPPPPPPPPPPPCDCACLKSFLNGRMRRKYRLLDAVFAPLGSLSEAGGRDDTEGAG